MEASLPQVLALSGGVGGAKLALGLAEHLPAESLHVLVNTGDDFEHLGMHISPDIDTLLYTLSGQAKPDQGWGLADETFHALAALERIGGETWFKLGDKDLATHLVRSNALAAGRTLAEVTRSLAQSMGISSHLHPMSDDAVRTIVHTDDGQLPFQHYFVREQCRPAVTRFEFAGIDTAQANPAVLRLTESGHVACIVICPSNPYVSIDPILRLPGLWQALRDCNAPVLVVSPIVGGRAIKGPAAKMMAELGVPVTATGVAEHYCRQYPGLVDYFVIDETDGKLAADIDKLPLEVAVTSTVMKSLQDKLALAEFVLGLARVA